MQFKILFGVSLSPYLVHFPVRDMFWPDHQLSNSLVKSMDLLREPASLQVKCFVRSQITAPPRLESYLTSLPLISGPEAVSGLRLLIRFEKEYTNGDLV